MTLHQAIEDDAVLVFLQPGDFRETVTYIPHRFFGEALRADREIQAVVIRDRYIINTDGFRIPIWEVHVYNNSTDGIASDEIDTGGDMIELPPRDGKEAESRTITDIVSQDHGMLVLECR